METDSSSPLASDAPAAASTSGEAFCAICQTPVDPAEPVTHCPACQAAYHQDCWTENRGCAVYGCEKVPPTEGRSTLEIPVAYWGQETKPCPVCNASILAAALRCRNCGTVFQTARPLDQAEFSAAASHATQAPKLRRAILWLFILCLIPFTAPVAGVIALIWFQVRAESIRKLSSIYGALIRIGIGVAFFQTTAVVVLAILFLFKQT